MISDLIFTIRSLMMEYKIDAYIVPNNDEFQNTNLPTNKQRLRIVSGFSGSNGVLIITPNKMILFTDSRYLLQAKLEIEKFNDDKIKSQYIILDMHSKSSCNILGVDLQQKILGYNPMLHTIKNLEYYKKLSEIDNFTLLPIEDNLIDKALINKNNNNLEINEAYLLDIEYSGITSKEKVSNVIHTINKNDIKNSSSNKIEYFLITSLESICWLLNIRGSDTPFTPLLQSYVILDVNNKKVKLFVELNKINNIKNNLSDLIEVYDINEIKDYYISLISKNKKIGLDPKFTSSWFIKTIQDLNDKEILEKVICYMDDPCILLKAYKNKEEIAGIEKSHIYDGIAICKFLTWLHESIDLKINITELDAVDELLKLRMQQPLFVYPSFPTISGFGENGAIVHYEANNDTNKEINSKDKGNLYLFDSGGQYKCGTTDITRTIAVGKTDYKHKKFFTAVLKGHINIASATFPKGTTGGQLDSLARYYLWQLNSDYGHSTGHGVGHFLSVHEGPHAISRSNNIELQPGMITSIEPGFYEEKEFGIRIENLYLVEQSNDDENFLQFKALSLVPIDLELVLWDELEERQKKWLINYHKLIENIIFPFLDYKEIQILKSRYKWL